MAFLYSGVSIDEGSLLVLTFTELNGDESEMIWRVPEGYKRDRFWDSRAGEGDFYGLSIDNWRVQPTRVRHAVEGEGFTDVSQLDPAEPSQFKLGDRLILVNTPAYEVWPDPDESEAEAKARAEEYAKRWLDWWELRITLSDENNAWFDSEPESIYAAAREIYVGKGQRGTTTAYRQPLNS